MKILIFLHGTLIMHKSAEDKTREGRVKQVENGDLSVHDYASYVPVGNAVEKLKSWQSQGAEIMTVTFVKPEIKQKIKSIVIKEFSGIDNLPSEISSLMK